MIVAGIIVGVILLAGMTYMALKKHSNFATRLASLIALAVMVLTVIICLFLIFTGGEPPVDESIVFVTGAPAEQPKSNSNFIALIFLILFLIGLFAVVMFLSIKEHKKESSSMIKSTSRKDSKDNMIWD
jgi:cytochrome bd-type quinol oxidase subunit 2